jgi:serine/threonine-protein kinase
MILVTGGDFTMGTNTGDEYARPGHSVTVKSFMAAKFLITNKQYHEFVKRSGHNPPASWGGPEPAANKLEEPVTNINWNDANAYCSWLSSQTGKSFSLLTEEQWEYLAFNSARSGVSELMGNYLEWTDTKFALDPGSKSKMADVPANVRILRGKNKDSISDPITYRFFQFENYANADLGFRVAQSVDTQ